LYDLASGHAQEVLKLEPNVEGDHAGSAVTAEADTKNTLGEEVI
jgi:hypothetical protein